MRILTLTAVLSGASTLCVVVSESQAETLAIQSVIGQQFEALKADDFERAFDFAAPSIKGMFGTAERFGQMVREGYPMVHRPSSVEYLGLREDRGGMFQRVLIRDMQGRAHVLDYSMVMTGSGWQIDGVLIAPGPYIGA